MELSTHTLQDLFLQLGLSGEQGEIDRFVATHRPLANSIELADASFWTPAQAEFLREEINDDADWAEIVDQLNVMLRE